MAFSPDFTAEGRPRYVPPRRQALQTSTSDAYEDYVRRNAAERAALNAVSRPQSPLDTLVAVLSEPSPPSSQDISNVISSTGTGGDLGGLTGNPDIGNAVSVVAQSGSLSPAEIASTLGLSPQTPSEMSNLAFFASQPGVLSHAVSNMTGGFVSPRQAQVAGLVGTTAANFIPGLGVLSMGLPLGNLIASGFNINDARQAAALATGNERNDAELGAALRALDNLEDPESVDLSSLVHPGMTTRPSISSADIASFAPAFEGLSFSGGRAGSEGLPAAFPSIPAALSAVFGGGGTEGAPAGPPGDPGPTTGLTGDPEGMGGHSSEGGGAPSSGGPAGGVGDGGGEWHRGGLVPWDSRPGPEVTGTLLEKEFVVNPPMTKKYLPLLQAINAGEDSKIKELATRLTNRKSKKAHERV